MGVVPSLEPLMPCVGPETRLPQESRQRSNEARKQIGDPTRMDGHTDKMGVQGLLHLVGLTIGIGSEPVVLATLEVVRIPRSRLE